MQFSNSPEPKHRALIGSELIGLNSSKVTNHPACPGLARVGWDGGLLQDTGLSVIK